ncbi:aminotransferase class I/II-fold pyridoxal phosphate-dependent enzyme [Nocardia sp. CDC160]|uniref:aminotransferase class I/II-fold pyridoxal phosphate-dependent enzyme n=1 Tax=Nocardia sp. CDC160 TaxID=3112166 RepID=UPI002DB5D837|nr:aminotransferase class I/II-fold pyridoxal phosphate-dependent enzyme [Nocardia sp. CDC160]MEC3919276.1 aminotransferase class I/II-fold pyridoxal phosphate-dependent enzyme [Nocardia sp. CDC160]
MSIVIDSVSPAVGSARGRFALGLSENPFRPLPSVLRALDDAMERVNRYPEFWPNELLKIIADRQRLLPNQVVVGLGATGVAMQIMRALVQPGQSVVFGSPTFDGYPIACHIAGVVPVPIPLTAGGDQDLAAFAAAIDARTGMVVVCRPHNPTGTVVPTTELEWLLGAVPDDVVVVLDEAYVEFLVEGQQVDAVRLVARHPNLVVLRTFSKAFGLAGLRIGYGFGAADIVKRVRRLQLPFGMNSAATVAVSASYAAEGELAERVRFITAERDSLRHGLRQIGIPVPRSSANFLYLPGRGISAALDRAGISAKSYPDGSARIAVGDPDAGRAVLQALNSAVVGCA